MRAFDALGFASYVRGESEEAVLLAIKGVQTLTGAERMWRAERAGACRPLVLRAADRRVAELGGEIPESEWIRLVAQGEAYD